MFKKKVSTTKCFKNIYYKKLSIEKAENTQEEFNPVLAALGKYNPRNSEYKNKKIKRLENVKRFYDGREIIINAFKNKTFPLHHDYHEEGRFEDEDEDDIGMKMTLSIIKSLID